MMVLFFIVTVAAVYGGPAWLTAPGYAICGALMLRAVYLGRGP